MGGGLFTALCYRSPLRNIVSFTGLFCQRDLYIVLPQWEAGCVCEFRNNSTWCVFVLFKKDFTFEGGVGEGTQKKKKRHPLPAE